MLFKDRNIKIVNLGISRIIKLYKCSYVPIFYKTFINNIYIIYIDKVTKKIGT